MRRASIGVAVFFGTLTILSLSAQPATQERRGGIEIEQVNGREAAAREVLVKFGRTAQPLDLAEIRALADADLVQTVGRTGIHRVRSKSLDATALLVRLASSSDIDYAEPNYIVHSFAEPNDAAFTQLWGLDNTGQAVNGVSPGLAGADIHAAQAWNISIGSTTQVVAVVDTGIDYTHPDLAANVWSAPSAFTVTIGGVPIVCPAGTHGFNAITLTCDPMDNHNHGTHVSGTIGASGNNGAGVAGVNWVTQLMGIKFLDATGSGTLADAINGIEFAIQAKQEFSATGGANVRVLSNDAFSNDLLPTYPASYSSPNVVAVAATTNTDTRAWFSNYGSSSVHLGAPGLDILSTTIGNGYGFSSGTSMATPHVSGAAALVLSQCALDTAGLKDVLLNTVEPVAALASTTMTGGRLDVNSAISSCIAPPATPTGLTALAGADQVTLKWSAAVGATRYNVKRSLSSGGPYAPLASNVTTKTYIDSAVDNGTPYYYVVSALNSLGESADSSEAFATPNAPSDLVVSSFTVPSTAGAGSPIAISDTTANLSATSAVASTTRFYLSANASLDGSDRLLSGAHAVPALVSGATSSASVSLDIPGDVAVGSYYLIAKADADSVVNETSESNNTSARLVYVGPDLVVSSLTGPATAAPGGTVVVTDTVKNQGGGAAAASSTRFYLSTNFLLDAADPLLAGGRAVPDLTGGAASSGSTTVTLPPVIATGTYYLIAKADADDAAVETQETNNTAARTIQIGGDLVVSSLTVPTRGAAGGTILVNDTTANRGAGALASSVTRFYLSTNAGLDAGDTPLAEGRVVPDLASGADSSGSTTVTIPAVVVPGAYYVIAKADADDAVAETQEGNNSTLRSITIGPDLTISSISVLSPAAAGSTVTVSDVVANPGAAGAGPSTTRFYLSTNFSLDASDLLLDGSRSVPAVAAGASNAGSSSVTIPPDTAPGTYVLIAKADADGGVPEGQESNNTRWREIRVTAAQ